MSILLAIPRELRDEIIDLVLSASYRTSPQDLDLERHQRRAAGDANVKYLSDTLAYVPNAYGLLLTNHQLHSETSKRLKWINKYELDIRVVSEEELWPTWTCIPSTSIRRIDTVEATFIAAGPGSNGRRSGFTPGVGEPPRIAWAFNSILERFLKLGPIAPISEGEQRNDRGISVKTIKMNFLTPMNLPDNVEIIPRGLPISRDRWRWYVRRGLIAQPDMSKDYIMGAKLLASFVFSFLRILIVSCPCTHGELLHQRVGEIHISIDGKGYMKWNLAANLAGLMLDDNLRPWVEEVARIRQEFGLPDLEYNSRVMENIQGPDPTRETTRKSVPDS